MADVGAPAMPAALQGGGMRRPESVGHTRKSVEVEKKLLARRKEAQEQLHAAYREDQVRVTVLLWGSLSFACPHPK